MQSFYDDTNRRYGTDVGTVGWQRRNLSALSIDGLTQKLQFNLRRQFGGTVRLPELRFYPHHASHAAAAFYGSTFDEALVLTVDGSGDSQSLTLWKGHGKDLTLLHEVSIPNSLGWFYAAVTEFLGFAAYDGEYKVMGLAAYGSEHLGFREKSAESSSSPTTGRPSRWSANTSTTVPTPTRGASRIT